MSGHSRRRGSGGDGLDPFSISYIGNQLSGAAASNITTFTNLPIGTAPSGSNTRFVVLAFSNIGGTARSVTAVSFAGGISATEVVSTTMSWGISIWIAEVPTGTTNTVTVTWSAMGAGSQRHVLVWSMINAASATAHASIADNTSTASALDLSLNVPSGGGVIAAVQTENVLGTIDWVGVTEADEFDSNADDPMAGAHGTTSGTPRTLTATATETPTTMRGAAASWAPA